MRLYEEAIGAARENGFVQNEGVANELAAQFYLKRRIEKVAHSYLRDARYCYLRWGALRKVQQLDERYPALEEDITELKRAEELQATMARERELFAHQRATELAKANEALRECLDALASVPELDEFLGQVMAAITRQLGAVSSLLRVRNFEQNTLSVELGFPNGRVMTPDEAKFPDCWRSLSVVEQSAACFLDQPATVTLILDPHSPIPEALRFYLLGLGVKTLLIIPFALGGQPDG